MAPREKLLCRQKKSIEMKTWKDKMLMIGKNGRRIRMDCLAPFPGKV